MFKEYKSKPIIRLAYEVQPEDSIITDPSNPSTSIIIVAGKPTPFKHHEPVVVGDYVINNGDEDIYHCSQETFHERNEVSYGEGYTFGEATEMAKQGLRVARRGWNGSGMFAYLVDSGCYPAKSDAIKGVFPDDMVPYRAYWALKTAQGDVATWTPSGSDTLANDWITLD